MSVSQNLSANIRALRLARNLSQSGLAKLAAVPRSTITHLESGSANPSLLNLVNVASAFQVGIEELLQKPRAECLLIKRNKIPTQKRAGGMATVFKLLPDHIPAMELDQMELEPQARMRGVPHTRNTKEYLICLLGKIEVVVSGSQYELEAGDLLAFAGDQPHSYSNPGSQKAECMSVVVLAPAGV